MRAAPRGLRTRQWSANCRVQSPLSRAGKTGTPGWIWRKGGPRHSSGHKVVKEKLSRVAALNFYSRTVDAGAAVRMAAFSTPTGVIISGALTAGMEGAVRCALRWDAARAGTLAVSLQQRIAPGAKMSLRRFSWRAFQILFATITAVLTQG